LRGLEDDDFGVVRGLVGFTREINRSRERVVRVGRDNGDEVGVIVLVVSLGLELGHVSMDDRIRRIHGHPVDHKYPLAVHSIRIFCLASRIQAFAEISVVCGCQVCIARFQDAGDDRRLRAVPQWQQLHVWKIAVDVRERQLLELLVDLIAPVRVVFLHKFGGKSSVAVAFLEHRESRYKPSIHLRVVDHLHVFDIHPWYGTLQVILRHLSLKECQTRIELL